MPLRGPDMSVGKRPGAVSEEAAGSDGSDLLAVGLSGPLGLYGAAGAATTAACHPTLGVPELMAAEGGFFARGTFRGCGQWCASSAGPCAPRCRLRKVARAGQLVGLELPRILG
jgi:hypothetical protein